MELSLLLIVIGIILAVLVDYGIGLAPEALVRCVLAARDRMPPATLVAVPLARRPDELRDALLR